MVPPTVHFVNIYHKSGLRDAKVRLIELYFWGR